MLLFKRKTQTFTRIDPLTLQIVEHFDIPYFIEHVVSKYKDVSNIKRTEKANTNLLFEIQAYASFI